MVIKRRELYEESDDTVYFFAIQTILAMINIKKKFLRGIESIFFNLYHANMYSMKGKIAIILIMIHLFKKEKVFYYRQ